MIKIISFETSRLRNKKAFENRHTSSKGNSTIKKALLSFVRAGIFSFIKTKTTTPASRVWGNMNLRSYNKKFNPTRGTAVPLRLVSGRGPVN